MFGMYKLVLPICRLANPYCNYKGAHFLPNDKCNSDHTRRCAWNTSHNWYHSAIINFLPHGIAPISNGPLLGRNFLSVFSKKSLRNVVIYGAGATGKELADSLMVSGDAWPVAFIDDDASLHGQNISGIRVYSESQISHLASSYSALEILLARWGPPASFGNSQLAGWFRFVCTNITHLL